MTLPTTHGTNYQKRLLSLYRKLYQERTGEQAEIDFKIVAPILKRLFTQYGEIKVAGAIVLHFEQNDKIEQAGFPLNWLSKQMPWYLGQLEQKGVDVDNDEELYSSIKSRLDYLDIKFEM